MYNIYRKVDKIYASYTLLVRACFLPMERCVHDAAKST
jgi:hypothetical protein